MREAIQCAAIRWFDEQKRSTIIWGYKKDLSNAHHHFGEEHVADLDWENCEISDD